MCRRRLGGGPEGERVLVKCGMGCGGEMGWGGSMGWGGGRLGLAEGKGIFVQNPLCVMVLIRFIFHDRLALVLFEALY